MTSAVKNEKIKYIQFLAKKKKGIIVDLSQLKQTKFPNQTKTDKEHVTLLTLSMNADSFAIFSIVHRNFLETSKKVFLLQQQQPLL